jgi:hypothetical protein
MKNKWDVARIVIIKGANLLIFVHDTERKRGNDGTSDY